MRKTEKDTTRDQCHIMPLSRHKNRTRREICSFEELEEQQLPVKLQMEEPEEFQDAVEAQYGIMQVITRLVDLAWPIMGISANSFDLSPGCTAVGTSGFANKVNFQGPKSD